MNTDATELHDRITEFAKLLQEGTCTTEEAGANLMEASRLFNEVLSNDPQLAASWDERVQEIEPQRVPPSWLREWFG